MKPVDFMIKLVWPGWFADLDRDKRIGFSSKYRNLLVPLGAKMLVYITEHQRIMGIYTATGDWNQGQRFPTTPGFPLNIPVKLDFVANIGLDMREIQKNVPNFRPHKDLSYHPLSQEEYNNLETLLLKRG